MPDEAGEDDMTGPVLPEGQAAGPNPFEGPDDRLDDRPAAIVFLANIKRELPRLERLLNHDPKWRYEDHVYRFWHQSCKVFWIQEETVAFAEALGGLHPHGGPLDQWFVEIVTAGTGRTFVMEDNQHWTERTLPMLEAFFHARFFVEMAVNYGRQLDQPPAVLPSGWAALLSLYGLR